MRSLHPILLTLTCAVACSSPNPEPITIANSEVQLTMEEQLQRLIGQMTRDEKVQQLGTPAPAISHLDLQVPAYEYRNECLHGVVADDGATSFPQAIALASTWDPALVKQVASAISDEARMLHIRNGKGLTYWAPVINMLRDPRWGRYEESYSEDPWLTSRMAVAYVQGLQGNDLEFLKVVSTPKYYAGNNSEDNRHNGSSDIDEQLLHEYYLPAFEAAVLEGKAFSVVAANNRVNGVPASANPSLLKDTLRTAWKFQGYVVSDCDAVADIYNGHGWTDSLAEAAGRALLAGTDLNCGPTYQNQLGSAYLQGFIAEADIDAALVRVLRARFKLGEFSHRRVPYDAIDAGIVESDEHDKLALTAAREAIVLLKNDPLMNGVPLLPLDKASGSIAVIGPHAADVTLGGYSGNPDPGHRVSFLAAMINRSASGGPTVSYEPGLDSVTAAADPAKIAMAVDAARAANVAIVLVGTDQGVMSEDHDRPDWSLPGAQNDLIQAVAAVNPNTVVVLVTAASVAVDSAQANVNVPAILTAFYDGQAQGTAIADVLFGDYNPGGKLTTTWYKGAATLPPIGDYDLRKGRTYLYYQDEPLYPFGFGLSYTKFAYHDTDKLNNLNIGQDPIDINGTATVSFEVNNDGPLKDGPPRKGDEVVQLYVQYVNPLRPIKQLVGFERVSLEPGQSKTVSFALPARRLAYWDKNLHDWSPYLGEVQVMVGSSSSDVRLTGTLIVGTQSAQSHSAVDAATVQ
jgi:beta-glucosidase